MIVVIVRFESFKQLNSQMLSYINISIVHAVLSNKSLTTLFKRKWRNCYSYNRLYTD